MITTALDQSPHLLITDARDCFLPQYLVKTSVSTIISNARTFCVFHGQSFNEEFLPLAVTNVAFGRGGLLKIILGLGI